ncbi:MAG: hypothetical protein HOI33_09150 [Rhodospirillaceae bacterium]|jgi:hypothetical protein|nr:hypothetical protein [Rhodospirillaceae bacterium]
MLEFQEVQASSHKDKNLDKLFPILRLRLSDRAGNDMEMLDIGLVGVGLVV